MPITNASRLLFAQTVCIVVQPKLLQVTFILHQFKDPHSDSAYNFTSDISVSVYVIIHSFFTD